MPFTDHHAVNLVGSSCSPLEKDKVMTVRTCGCGHFMRDTPEGIYSSLPLYKGHKEVFIYSPQQKRFLQTALMMKGVKEVGSEDKAMHARASAIRKSARLCLLQENFWAPKTL